MAETSRIRQKPSRNPAGQDTDAAWSCETAAWDFGIRLFVVVVVLVVVVGAGVGTLKNIDLFLVAEYRLV